MPMSTEGTDRHLVSLNTNSLEEIVPNSFNFYCIEYTDQGDKEEGQEE